VHSAVRVARAFLWPSFRVGLIGLGSFLCLNKGTCI
jgi:hypothetical protein